MKKLFNITEEEKKRILGLHESATKRQYLSEAKVTGDQVSGTNIQFDKETKYTQDIFNLVFQKTNVDETRLTDAIISIPDLNTFIKVNNELKNAFKLIGSKYSGLDSIIADVIDFGNDDTDVERLRTYFKRIGVTTNQLGNDYYSFGELNPKSEELPNPQETKVETNWKNYPCVTSHPKAKQVKLTGGSFKYTIGNFDYYSNGRKKNITTKQMSSYNCETEFKQVKQRTVPSSIDQLLQPGYYLRKGDEGDLVKRLQNKLLDSGEEVSVTSVFDDMTKQAVINFQTKNNLKADGVVGPKTWVILSKSKAENLSTKDTESLKTIAPSNVPSDYGRTNKGVANPNQTPIRGTGRGSGLGQMGLNQP